MVTKATFMAFVRKYGFLILGIIVACTTIALISFAYINTNKLDEFLRQPDRERKAFIIQSQQEYLLEFKKIIGLYEQEISIKNAGNHTRHYSMPGIISNGDLSSYKTFLEAKKILERSESVPQKEKALKLLGTSAKQKSFAAQYYLAAYLLEKKKILSARKLLLQAATDNGTVAEIYLALFYGQG